MCIVTFDFFTALGGHSVWEQYHYMDKFKLSNNCGVEVYVPVKKTCAYGF